MEKGMSVFLGVPSYSLKRRLKQIFLEHGHLICGEASDGSKSLQVIRRMAPDLVVLDYDINGLSGLELVKIIEEDAIAPTVFLVPSWGRELMTLTEKTKTLVVLVKPVQQSSFLSAVSIVTKTFRQFRRMEEEMQRMKNTLETRKLTERAKGILMKNRNVSEEEAYKMIQRQSMDRCVPMRQVAEAIVLTNGMNNEGEVKPAIKKIYPASTGFDGLDQVIDSLRIGDNVVWQVEDIEEYIRFAVPFARQAKKDGKRVVYMRFAGHREVLEAGYYDASYYLDATQGFELFSTQVHRIASLEGEGVFYVFDCLSELLSAWATDLMIGNFFMVTCPYLFELNTVAYFALLRNHTSIATVINIRETTQVFLDVYRGKGNTYVYPKKVSNRYAPFMFLPHLQKGNNFIPLTGSIDAARLYSDIGKNSPKERKRNWDYWEQIFSEAAMLWEESNESGEEKRKYKMVGELCKFIIGRDERILFLAKKYFDLGDLIKIKSRIIGSGLIGGKAVGMLLARKVLSREGDQEFACCMEPHDSFFVGADVFYTYLVKNGLWKLRLKQKEKEHYFEAGAQLKKGILQGEFPQAIRQEFQCMLEYFGQSPIIVRSSSLQEDSFGNAFAGKYLSIFCANQGTPHERYKYFEDAVRQVYASIMGEDALTYRRKRGLDQHDEQMALLVQRVSGDYQKDYFFPAVSGVGLSYNTYVWNDTLSPEAGLLRLVAGLGTRAVGRAEGDYPRMVALDRPMLKLSGEMTDQRQFSQHEVDVLNIKKNSFQTIPLKQLAEEGINFYGDLIGVRDYEAEREMKGLGKEQRYWVLNFEKFLSKTAFSTVMRRILKILESAYGYPVNIEFTVNFSNDGGWRLNILQCRPLATKGKEKKVIYPEEIEESRVIFQSSGGFMGGNMDQVINRIIYVDPAKYSKLALSYKYEVARLIGSLNRKIKNQNSESTFLLGPGRWGSGIPSIGVPVSFSEISNMTVIGELAQVDAGFSPELSYGSHFFQDLVESDIFYVAIFPGDSGVLFNNKWFNQGPNILEKILPEKNKWNDVVRVKETDLCMVSDVVSQRIICYKSQSCR